MDRTARLFFTEAIGTLAFVFLSTAVVCANQLTSVLELPRIGLTGIALGTGFAYAGLLMVTVPLTGGFLNPAVPLTFWVFRRMDGGRAAGLILAQCLGAIVAGLLVRYFFRGNETALVLARLGTPHLNLESFGAEGLTLSVLLQGVAIELVLTFFLVFAIFGLLFDARVARLAGEWTIRLAGLWLGLIVTAAVLAGYAFTGAALNPARWLGPVVWEYTLVPLSHQAPLTDHLVYWLGPTLGALVAGALYTGVILPPETAEAPGVESRPALVTSTLFRRPAR